jgi:hypothetical protein
LCQINSKSINLGYFLINQETIALCLRKYFFLVRAQLLALIVAKTILFDVKEIPQRQQSSGISRRRSVGWGVGVSVWGSVEATPHPS